MAGVDASAMWELVSSLQGLNGNESIGSTEQATCTRVDNDGTVWVRLLGAEIDTPVNGQRLADVVVGDNVTVTIEDGLLSVIGNSSRPSTSASHVEEIVGPVVQKVTEVVSVVADKASVGELQAATARIGELEADHVAVDDLTAVTGRIQSLESDHVSVADFQAEQANIDTLQANTADIDTIRANSAKVQNLTAAQLEADHATIGTLDTTYATIANLNAANGRITNLESTKANISDLEANYITADEIEATYMHADMANADVAWIQNGTIKNGAIVSAMINDVSANKLTAGTINGSVINVTNLNADNITTGTINGQRIGEGSLSLSKLDESVYTEAEVNNIVDGLNDRIDGAIETYTGTVVPTLNNSPASSWNTTKLRDEHVGDVYYVVNSQSEQNGYCYRFTKSGSTYSWQLIKDSDVTAALSRLTAAEGKITTFDSDISTLKTDTGTLTTRTTNLETRADDVDAALLDKVDVTTFNEVSDTVDAHSQTISQHTTAISNKADSSTVTAVTNRVSKTEQDISGINTTIGELQDTVETKADGSTVSTISSKLNTVSDTVDGHTQAISSVQNTLSTKADSSTVSTLTTKVNNVSDTVDGHTSQLTSITSTQTSMQSTLDKTVKSSIQLWYSKANTTAPSKPTSQVTSTSTSGNAWRTVVPSYNASYPNYYYCWQYEYVDGTYGWSSVVRDIAMGESQATARTADTNASAAQNTANANIKSSVQLWFTKADGTAPNKPTSVVSTSNANTSNTWNLVVPVWNSSYPHYFYCYQQQKGDGTYQWTDVVYDRATSEAQQLANTTSTNLSTLQTNYATFKQTTEQFESTVGSRLTTIESDIDGVEERVSDNETSISNNASAIALKANSSDVYTKTAVDGKITQEVTDRNAAITAKANEINLSVTEKVYQGAQPNLTPYFSCNRSDSYWNDSTVDGTASDWTFEQGGPDGKGGWAHFSVTNTTNATIYLRSYISKDALDLKPSSAYTFLVEWADISMSGGTANLFSTTQHGGGGMADDFFTTTTSTTLSSGSGSKYISATTRAELEAACPNRIRTHLWVGAGITVSGYLRISLYEGEYSGPYKPYIGTQLYASQAELKVTNDSISTKVDKDGVISSINQSAESVKIQASKVEIDGTAVFNAIKSSTDAAYDAKGAASTAETNAKAYVDAIEVGGRNLIWDSTWLDTGNRWAAWGSPQTREVVTLNGKRWLHIVTDSRFQGWQQSSPYRNGYGEITAGDELTVSFSAYAAVAHNFGCAGLHFLNSSGSIITQAWFNANMTTTATKFVFHATAPDGCAGFNFMIGDGAGGGHEIWFSDLKLEKGNKPTDWTPAPEDLQSSAVSRTQRIWYRWNSATAPTAPTTWVTKGDDGSALWTKMHVAITSTHKYIYTCEQYEMADGTLGHTDVLLDNTITVIDGGNIITGTVTANKLNASDINASKTLTVGAMTDAAAETILNSNVQVGGRNLALDSQYFSHNATANDTYVGVWSLPVAQRVYVSRSDGFVALAVKQSQNWAGPAVYMDSLGLAVGDLVAFSCLYEYQGCNANLHFYAMSTNSSGTRIYPTFDLRGSNGYSGNYHSVTQLAVISSSNPSGKVWVVAEWSQAAQDTIDAGGHVCFTFQVSATTEVTSGGSVHLYATKLERGNKATDWTPAPEDVDADISEAAQTATNYIVADSSGIKIADASPSSATTYLHLASSFLDFIRGGASMLKAWLDGSVAKVRVGAESGFNTLTDGEGIKLRNGTTVLGQFATNLIELGKGSTSAVIEFCGGLGRIGYNAGWFDTFLIDGNGHRVAITGSGASACLSGSGGLVGVGTSEAFMSFDNFRLYSNDESIYNYYGIDEVTNAIPVSLYDNDSASASAAATLSETAANFRRLTIMYRDQDNTYGSVDVWNPNGKRVSLDLTWINGASTQQMYQRVRWVTISGTTISTAKDSGDSKYRTGQVRLGGSYSVTNSDYISIVHVIGYR